MNIVNYELKEKNILSLEYEPKNRDIENINIDVQLKTVYILGIQSLKGMTHIKGKPTALELLQVNNRNILFIDDKPLHQI